MKYYLVPQSIAESQRLTRLRTKSDDGRYIVSQADIISYGVAEAIAEGAEEISESKAKEIVKFKKK